MRDASDKESNAVGHDPCSREGTLRGPSLSGQRGVSESESLMDGDRSNSRRPSMPNGLRLFLGYALAILILIGLSLRFVIDMAISAPVSLPGAVVMILLAYTVFTITLVLQRKEAARRLALGLASLTIPAIPLALLSFASAASLVAALFFAALAAALFRGLLRPEVRAYLDQP